MNDFVIRTVVCGAIQNNTYIIKHKDSASAVVIDPAGSGADVVDELRKMGVQVELVLLTHGHFDHIEGLDAVRKAYDAPVAIHRADAGMLVDASQNLSRYLNRPISFAAADRLLDDGDEIQAAGLTIVVISTPGHTRGGVSFLVGDALFTGDTLFHLDAGRTDFPYSSTDDLFQSIERLFALPGDYRVFPGHEEDTTLEFERNNNTFMKSYRRRRK